MALTKIEFAPGIMKDKTPLASEGGFVDANWIRFRRLAATDTPRPQCIGGFEKLGPSITGVARGAASWADRQGQPVLAYGTSTSAFAYGGGVQSDITPPTFEGWLTDPFTTESGTPTVSIVFNVYDPDSDTSTIAPHGLKVDDIFSVTHPVTIGGITLTGDYAVKTVISPTKFTIDHTSNASSTASMSSAPKVWVTIPLRPGLVSGTGGLGFGTGLYGLGTYGQANTSDYLPALWHMQPYGTDLLGHPRQGALFRYQPDSLYADLVVNGDFAASAGWATGTGWTIGSGVATATAGTGSNLSQNIEDVAEGGRVYRVTFDVVRSAGACYFGVNAGSPPAVVRLSPDIAASGTYTLRFQCPAQPIDFVIGKDSAFAGTIDNVSLSLEDAFYRIDEAPIQSEAMFVDPRGLVVLLGTFLSDGTYSPMAVRNSGLQNEREWVPDTDSLASETTLSRGSRLIGGLPTRSQNFIWSDTSLYGMSYTGEAGNAFSFSLLASGCGLIAPLAAVEHAGFVFWMANSGQFFSATYDFQGAVPRPIECSVKDYVFKNLAVGQNEKIWAWANTEYNEIWWFYADATIGSEINSYVIFSIETGAWSIGRISRTAGVGAGVFSAPILISSDGANSGLLYYHETGNSADGEPLASFIQSAPFDIATGDKLAAIVAIQPDFLDQQGNLTFQIYGNDTPRSPVRQPAPLLCRPDTEWLRTRFMARRVWFRIEGNSSPSAWALGALHADVIATGARR